MSNPESNWLGTLHDAASTVAIIVTLSRFATYAGLSFGYNWYYAQLGLSPGDVGISYGDVIANSWGAGAILAGALVVSFIAGIMAVSFTKDEDAQNSSFFATSAISLIALFIGLIFLMVFLLGQRVDSVRRGDAVRPIGPVGFTIVQVRATPISPEWVGARSDSPFRRGHRFELIGQANNSIVIYDVTTRTLIRAPSSAITIQYSIKPRICSKSDFHGTC